MTSFIDPLLDQLKSVKKLAPRNLRRAASSRLSDLIDAEVLRAKARIEALQRRYPSAGPRELCQRLIDGKKQLASMVGGITGVFGAITVPVDLGGMVYLQLSLLVEIATVHKVNLKADSAKQELLDLLGYSNGIGPIQRASPKVLGSLARLALTRGGLEALGRAMPFVAAPVSAYLNNQHVQRVGDAAMHHYDGWVRAHEKTKKASGQ